MLASQRAWKKLYKKAYKKAFLKVDQILKKNKIFSSTNKKKIKKSVTSSLLPLSLRMSVLKNCPFYPLLYVKAESESEAPKRLEKKLSLSLKKLFLASLSRWNKKQSLVSKQAARAFYWANKGALINDSLRLFNYRALLSKKKFVRPLFTFPWFKNNTSKDKNKTSKEKKLIQKKLKEDQLKKIKPKMSIIEICDSPILNPQIKKIGDSQKQKSPISRIEICDPPISRIEICDPLMRNTTISDSGDIFSSNKTKLTIKEFCDSQILNTKMLTNKPMNLIEICDPLIRPSSILKNPILPLISIPVKVSFALQTHPGGPPLPLLGGPVPGPEGAREPGGAQGRGPLMGKSLKDFFKTITINNQQPSKISKKFESFTRRYLFLYHKAVFIHKRGQVSQFFFLPKIVFKDHLRNYLMTLFSKPAVSLPPVFPTFPSQFSSLPSRPSKFSSLPSKFPSQLESIRILASPLALKNLNTLPFNALVLSDTNLKVAIQMTSENHALQIIKGLDGLVHPLTQGLIQKILIIPRKTFLPIPTLFLQKPSLASCSKKIRIRSRQEALIKIRQKALIKISSGSRKKRSKNKSSIKVSTKLFSKAPCYFLPKNHKYLAALGVFPFRLLSHSLTGLRGAPSPGTLPSRLPLLLRLLLRKGSLEGPSVGLGPLKVKGRGPSVGLGPLKEKGSLEGPSVGLARKEKGGGVKVLKKKFPFLSRKLTIKKNQKPPVLLPQKKIVPVLPNISNKSKDYDKKSPKKVEKLRFNSKLFFVFLQTLALPLPSLVFVQRRAEASQTKEKEKEKARTLSRFAKNPIFDSWKKKHRKYLLKRKVPYPVLFTSLRIPQLNKNKKNRVKINFNSTKKAKTLVLKKDKTPILNYSSKKKKVTLKSNFSFGHIFTNKQKFIAERRQSSYKLINNIYCLSHRFTWENDLDWIDFLEYVSAPISFTDKAIPKYEYRLNPASLSTLIAHQETHSNYKNADLSFLKEPSELPVLSMGIAPQPQYKESESEEFGFLFEAGKPLLQKQKGIKDSYDLQFDVTEKFNTIKKFAVLKKNLVHLFLKLEKEGIPSLHGEGLEFQESVNALGSETASVSLSSAKWGEIAETLELEAEEAEKERLLSLKGVLGVGDLFSPYNKKKRIPPLQRGPNGSDGVITQGGGLIKNLLTELTFKTRNWYLSGRGGEKTELNQMDQNNRYLLYEANKLIYGLKINLIRQTFWDPEISDKKNETIEKDLKKYLKELLAQRILLIRRTNLVRKLFVSTKSGQSPSSMVLSILPVLPPDLRPIVKMGSGANAKVAATDLNRLYQRVIYRNERLKKFLRDPALLNSTSNLSSPMGALGTLGNYNRESSTEIKFTQGLLQEAVDNLIQNNKSGVPAEKDSRGRALKSLSDILKGKQGRFRQYLLGKRVDYSGRSVIIVGPKLKIHQCGIPKEMALELFLPFLLKKILNFNLARTVVGAKTLIHTNKPLVWELLTEIMKACPVLLNRAPTLHRLGIQAFIPKLVDGRAILLHPLVCSAFNADFDGDQMAVHIPITVESRAEAWKLMLSRNNLLSPATGEPISVPSQDMVLGCYYLTTQCAQGTTKKKKGFGLYFKSEEDVLKAYYQQKIDLHAAIWLQCNGLIEDTNEIESPIEIRIPKYGAWKVIYPRSHINYYSMSSNYDSGKNPSESEGGKNFIEYEYPPLKLEKSVPESSKNYHSSYDQESESDKNFLKISHYIKTTPGKIVFNSIIKKSIHSAQFISV